MRRNVIINFDTFNKKPKAGYTIIFKGTIAHYGSVSSLTIEVSGLASITDLDSKIEREVVLKLEEGLKEILGFIEPSTIRKKINKAKKECTYFAYKVYTESEEKIIVERIK